MLNSKAGETVEFGEGNVIGAVRVNLIVVAVDEELHRLRGVEVIIVVEAWRDSLMVYG